MGLTIVSDENQLQLCANDAHNKISQWDLFARTI